MKPLKSIYCRIYQIVLRVALPILPYRVPTQLNQIEQTSMYLKEKKISKVLLVTDRGVIENGLTTVLEKSLIEEHMKLPG